MPQVQPTTKLGTLQTSNSSTVRSDITILVAVVFTLFNRSEYGEVKIYRA